MPIYVFLFSFWFLKIQKIKENTFLYLDTFQLLRWCPSNQAYCGFSCLYRQLAPVSCQGVADKLFPFVTGQFCRYLRAWKPFHCKSLLFFIITEEGIIHVWILTSETRPLAFKSICTRLPATWLCFIIILDPYGVHELLPDFMSYVVPFFQKVFPWIFQAFHFATHFIHSWNQFSQSV